MDSYSLLATTSQTPPDGLGVFIGFLVVVGVLCAIWDAIAKACKPKSYDVSLRGEIKEKR